MDNQEEFKQIEQSNRSLWSTRGFYIGVGIFFASAIATALYPKSFYVGLVIVIFLGLRAKKFGYVSGFLSGIFIAIGLVLLLLCVICGGPLLKGIIPGLPGFF
ncbi:MAG: hypothetical protein KBC84_04595 [Proteobacteria bacterium]|nr:hypothetical protein [Pseudomonadota bacterium]